MSTKRPAYRLLVELQYPPHPHPLPAGTVVRDFPPASVAWCLAHGWIEEVPA